MGAEETVSQEEDPSLGRISGFIPEHMTKESRSTVGAGFELNDGPGVDIALTRR